MSVYINIKDAELTQEVSLNKPKLIIKSPDTQFEAQAMNLGNRPVWNVSIISSDRQKSIMFEILNSNNKDNRPIKGQLYFSTIRGTPQRQISQTLPLSGGGKLNLDIFYTQRKNFLGEIAFYQYKSMKIPTPPIETAASNDYLKSAQKTQPYTPRDQKLDASLTKASKSAGLFFCCGDEGNDKQFTLEQDLGQPENSSFKFKNELTSKKQKKPHIGFADKSPTNDQTLKKEQSLNNYKVQQLASNKDQVEQSNEGVTFYKGPCKSTNLFSCLDPGLQDQKFTIVQDYYRDK